MRTLQFAADDGATVQSIARQLGCAANSASELIRRLVDKGLVSKRRSETDERVVEVRLTAAGGQVLEEQTGLDVQRLARCLDALSEAEQDAIRAGLGGLLVSVRGARWPSLC